MGPRRNQQSGFTLTELMVVIALIGILSSIVMGLNPGTYGASPKATGEQIVGTIDLARMRAVSARRVQRVQANPQSVQVFESLVPGMVAPADANDWELVSEVTLSSASTIRAGATTAVTTLGSTVTDGDNLPLTIDLFPDGSATPATIFIAASAGAKKSRVLIYRATGSAYVREGW